MQKRCSHCGTNLYSINQIEDFCCLGCKAAYALINSLNLSNYYTYCNSIYNVSPMKVNEAINELNYLEYISQSKNGNKILLLIEDIHCGACVWLIENSLKKQKNVISARVNLSTKRLSLEWSGERGYIYELIHILEKLGYRAIPFVNEDLDTEQKKNELQLLKCLIISGVVSMQVMMITIGVWVGNVYGSMGEYTRLLLHIIAALITIPAIVYSGRPFFKSALVAIKARRSNMDVPISIGIIASTLISISETINSGKDTYYDAAISLLFILLIGRYLDLRVRNKARKQAHVLIMSQPRSVTIYDTDGNLKLIDIKKAQVGQIAVISAGEKVPIDGVVIEGSSHVDNSIITGETVASAIYKGSEVFAGSINLVASIKVQISKASENTLLSEIIKLIENAEQGRAKYVMLADRISSYYTPFIITVSTLTFCIWKFILLASFNQSLINATSVLIITCPCALALSVPIVQIVAVLKLMRNGILIKASDTLERLANINTIIFDKTGTLTEGRPNLINKKDFSITEMALMSSLAVKSKHILLSAIKDIYKDNIYDLNVYEEKGRGLKALYEGKEIRLGSKEWCNIKGDTKDDNLEMWFKYGRTKKRLILQDLVRPEAKQVIAKLKKAGYAIYILSGDRESAVKKIASQVKIAYYESALKPYDKYIKIEGLQRDGKFVLMVGDGLNDSAALRVAHASLSPACGLAVTQNNADAVFQTDLRSVDQILRVAKVSERLVKENLSLSLLYNIITIPLAASGMVTPLIAAIAMSSSSILVTLNAMRLNKKNEM